MFKADLSKASTLARLDEFCVQYDIDYRDALTEAKLSVDVLDNPENLIAFSRIGLLLENCTLRSGQPLFSLEYGIFQGTAVYGRLLYVIRNAQTVGESLRELVRYYSLLSSGAQVSVEVEDKIAIMKYDILMLNGARSHYVADRAIGIGCALLKMLLGASWQPSGVYYQSAPKAGSAAYQRLLGVVPQFNSSINALVFDAELLNRPLSESDPLLHNLIREHFDRMERLSTRELPAYVQELIKKFLPEGPVTTEKIAKTMMLSPRSLQRYLAAQGTSFQVLLDSTRRAMAEHYLSESAISLTQLAGILGYADLATFSRAFRRWYGVSPRQWRSDNSIASMPPWLARQPRK